MPERLLFEAFLSRADRGSWRHDRIGSKELLGCEPVLVATMRVVLVVRVESVACGLVEELSGVCDITSLWLITF